MSSMKNLICLVYSLGLIIGSSCNHNNEGATQLYIIGTVHESSTNINSDSILLKLEAIKPDVILCELEQKYFTKDHSFNLERYNDLLSTNENIATNLYQQKYGIPLRPYDIEGRNEYYQQTQYFSRVAKIFSAISKAYDGGALSVDSKKEWDTYMNSVEMFDILNNRTLAQINRPLEVGYSQAKNIVMYNTLISICKRDFPEHLESALLVYDYWNKRNDAMARNILTLTQEYTGKRVVVLCGHQHKYDLLSRINFVSQQYREKKELPYNIKTY